MYCFLSLAFQVPNFKGIRDHLIGGLHLSSNLLLLLLLQSSAVSPSAVRRADLLADRPDEIVSRAGSLGEENKTSNRGASDRWGGLHNERNGWAQGRRGEERRRRGGRWWRVRCKEVRGRNAPRAGVENDDLQSLRVQEQIKKRWPTVMWGVWIWILTVRDATQTTPLFSCLLAPPRLLSPTSCPCTLCLPSPFPSTFYRPSPERDLSPEVTAHFLHWPLLVRDQRATLRGKEQQCVYHGGVFARRRLHCSIFSWIYAEMLQERLLLQSKQRQVNFRLIYIYNALQTDLRCCGQDIPVDYTQQLCTTRLLTFIIWWIP